MPSYVVYKGKVPGVYDDWEECRRQVHRFSGNSYKGYTTRAEAEVRYARYLAGERRERLRLEEEGADRLAEEARKAEFKRPNKDKTIQVSRPRVSSLSSHYKSISII